MKMLSKAIYVLSRITKVVISIGFVFIALLLLFVPIFISNTKIEENSITIFDETVNYEVHDNELIIIDGNNKMNIDMGSSLNVNTLLETPKTNIIIGAEFIIICLGVSLVFGYLLFSNLEEIFVDIHNQDTPFTLQNVKRIKMLAIYIISMLVFEWLTGSIFEILTNVELNIELEMKDIIFSLVIFSIAYIFEYGYQIQLDSNGKIYGEIDE